MIGIYQPNCVNKKPKTSLDKMVYKQFPHCEHVGDSINRILCLKNKIQELTAQASLFLSQQQQIYLQPLVNWGKKTNLLKLPKSKED